MGSNPTLSASKIKASEHFAWKPFLLLIFIFDSLFDSQAVNRNMFLHT